MRGTVLAFHGQRRHTGVVRRVGMQASGLARGTGQRMADRHVAVCVAADSAIDFEEGCVSESLHGLAFRYGFAEDLSLVRSGQTDRKIFVRSFYAAARSISSLASETEQTGHAKVFARVLREQASGSNDGSPEQQTRSVERLVTMIEHDGWKVQYPNELCTCRSCMQAHDRMQATGKVADACAWLASQARCTGEITGIQTPDGASMVFRPVFVVAPGSAWDTDGDDYGYSTYAVRDSEPTTEPLLADLLDLGLDVPQGAN